MAGEVARLLPRGAAGAWRGARRHARRARRRAAAGAAAAAEAARTEATASARATRLGDECLAAWGVARERRATDSGDGENGDAREVFALASGDVPETAWRGPIKLSQRGRTDDRARRSSRSSLCKRDLAAGMFPGTSLHDDAASALCELGAERGRVPRKEWHESWAVATAMMNALPAHAARNRCVVDCAGGHGLAGQLALLVAHPEATPVSALCVDVRVPAYANAVHAVLAARYPKRLAGRVRLAHGARLETLRPHARALLLGVHACGALTDVVLEKALKWRAPVALLPCCHDKVRSALALCVPVHAPFSSAR